MHPSRITSHKNEHNEKELTEQIAHLKILKAEQKKQDDSLKSLHEEIIRCIQGKSAFSQDTLADLIRDTEENTTGCE